MTPTYWSCSQEIWDAFDRRVTRAHFTVDGQLSSIPSTWPRRAIVECKQYLPHIVRCGRINNSKANKCIPAWCSRGKTTRFPVRIGHRNKWLAKYPTNLSITSEFPMQTRRMCRVNCVAFSCMHIIAPFFFRVGEQYWQVYWLFAFGLMMIWISWKLFAYENEHRRTAQRWIWSAQVYLTISELGAAHPSAITITARTFLNKCLMQWQTNFKLLLTQVYCLFNEKSLLVRMVLDWSVCVLFVFTLLQERFNVITWNLFHLNAFDLSDFPLLRCAAI